MPTEYRFAHSFVSISRVRRSAIGAYLFGALTGGTDRRKGALIALFFNGRATFLFAFVPGYNQIGVWGASY